MIESEIEGLERRVLILTPTARDAAASRSILEANGINVCIRESIDALCEEAERGAGALLIPEEALETDKAGLVRRLVERQPTWSDLPLIVLTPSGREHPAAVRAYAEFTNVTLVKRPVELSVFVSTVQAALRDRARQYEVRAHLAALHRGEERFRALVTASSDVIYRMAPDWSEMYRLEGREFLADSPGSSRNWLEHYIAPEDHAQVRKAIAEAIQSKGAFEMEHRVHRVDGSIGWTSSRAVPILNADGEILEWFGTATDVTERKRSEERLRASEERYRTLFETIDEGFCVAEVIFDDLDQPIDYRFLEVNPAFERLTGLSNATGKRMRELAPKHEAHWFETYGEVARTGRPVRFENEAKELGGRWFDVYAFRIGEPDGRKVAILFTEITERKDLEHSLRDRVQDLAEVDRKKDDFIALLAHELRSPLAPIRNGVNVLRLAGADPETAEETREIMERQVTHMVRLIDDLLDVSRINRNKMELRLSRVTLAEAVRSAVETARPNIDAEGHALSVSIPEKPIYLQADLTRLAQVFSNLLTNSAKYTRHHGKIWLEAQCIDGRLIVSVTDNGIGIPDESLANIFDMFSQVDRSVERDTGGLGIGLALVKGLVEMHGGTVAAASDGDGKGSTFTVSLPVVEPAVTPSPTPKRNSQVKARRRILIVDDSRDGASTLGRMLKLMGNDVRTANDGLEGVEVAAEFLPEIVLMDIGMPVLNGLDATRRIREQEWGRGMTIIALTGWGQEGDKERSREAGCNGHLVKPVDIEDLEKLLAVR